jgi:cytochrome b561
LLDELQYRMESIGQHDPALTCGRRTTSRGASSLRLQEPTMTQTSVRTPVEIYTKIARRLHWTTVLLLAIQIPVGLYMVYRGNTLNLWDNLTNALYSGHKLVGLVILVIVIWRLVYRFRRGAPVDEPTIEPWQRIVSRLNHWGLYLLLLVTPIVGYVGISLFPALDIFGVPLPGVVAPDKEAAKTAFGIHGLLVLLLVLMIALHVAAALYHYLIRKDNVLGRMIPRLLRQPGIPAQDGSASRRIV